MYQSFILYIIIILIYSTHIPPGEQVFTHQQVLVLQAALYLLFLLLCRTRMTMVIQGIRKHRLSEEQVAEAYDRCLSQLTILAVIIYISVVYLLNIKAVISSLPLLSASTALGNLAAFCLFLGYQLILWCQAHTVFSRRLDFEPRQTTYCARKLLFALGIILPWVCIMGMSDLFQFLAPEIFVTLTHHPGMYLALFALFLLALTVIAPPLTVKLWGCRPLPDSPLRRCLEGLCSREGVGYRQIMLWPSVEGKMVTAAVMGPYPFTRYLLLTEGLIELLSLEEIKAVMAHEIGHVKRHHLFVYLVFFLSLFLLNLAFFELLIGWLLTTDFLQDFLFRAPHQQATIISLATTLPLLLIYLLYFRFVFGYFLRNFEREADLYVFHSLGTAESLITAFQKLSWVTGDHGQRANWHHYNIPQRIAYLLECGKNPALIAKHQRKVKTGLAAFLLCVASLGFFGYHLNSAGLRQSLDNRFLIKVMERYTQEHPDEANAAIHLGTLYYEEGEYLLAKEHFERARTLAGNHPELLNNYAWMLLTVEAPQIQNIDYGFTLARQASAIKRAPHILDTLAEGYWRRGMPCMALDLERQILAGKPKQPEVYQRQADKFARDCQR
ncbi:MAG: M48 family metalloprotease [Deltaproteobacteria bacterium]|nr:M48 family metalloprotease [Candidatus Anaeroferrophillus wilburensis]MBN2887776.1 M48 family metalloprotease [Deltaproteobacteria bacterium]